MKPRPALLSLGFTASLGIASMANAAQPAVGQTIPDADARRVLAKIQASQTEGNVPDEPTFSRLLQRDLSAFFAAKGFGRPAVQFELLRRAATQSGVAYPKYYLWVRVHSANGRRVAGAVRAAAVERRRFEITDFLSVGEIAREPERVGSIFPAPLVEGIVARATSKGSRGND